MATPPQDPTPRLRSLDKIFSGRIKAEDRIISDVVKDMLGGSSELSDRIVRRINRLDVDSSGNVKQTDKNLREVEQINQLIARGTDFITRQAISNLQGRTTELNNFYSSEISAWEPSISKKGITNIVDANQTRAVLNTNLDNMRAVSNSLSQEIRRQLTASLFEDIGPEEISRRINRALVGKVDARGNSMTRHGETIARTAYNGYANALTLQNVNLEEVVAYYYSGPQDSRNRTFCSARVEQVHAKETLENDIVTQPGGTLHNPGGFNCRHKLFPVSMFDLEGEPFLTDEQRREVMGAKDKGATGRKLPEGAVLAKDRQENAPRAFKQSKIPTSKKQKTPESTGGAPTNDDLKRQLDESINETRKAENDLVDANNKIKSLESEISKLEAKVKKLES